MLHVAFKCCQSCEEIFQYIFGYSTHSRKLSIIAQLYQHSNSSPVCDRFAQNSSGLFVQRGTIAVKFAGEQF